MRKIEADGMGGRKGGRIRPGRKAIILPPTVCAAQMLLGGEHKKRKRPSSFPEGLSYIPAMSYFPTQLPAQYHWRCGA